MNEFTAQDYIAILIQKYHEDFGVLPFTASDEEGEMIKFDIDDEYLQECYKYIPEDTFVSEFEKFVNTSLENMLNSLTDEHLAEIDQKIIDNKDKN
jgi:5S rRNA maturation endonuclease (ribonuclease M5)